MTLDDTTSTACPSTLPKGALSRPSTPALAPTLPSPSAVVALSPGRYKIQFTASTALRDKLERLRALMRSEVPDGDLSAILERAVTEKLERLEARRFAKAAAPRKPLPASPLAPTTRRIPAAVRRAVVARDGSRCTFVDAQGRRCSERHRLEFHHRHPFGMGGDHSLGNVGLLCAAHNRHLAELDYGRTTMDAAVAQPRSLPLQGSDRALGTCEPCATDRVCSQRAPSVVVVAAQRNVTVRAETIPGLEC